MNLRKEVRDELFRVFLNRDIRCLVCVERNDPSSNSPLLLSLPHNFSVTGLITQILYIWLVSCIFAYIPLTGRERNNLPNTVPKTLQISIQQILTTSPWVRCSYFHLSTWEHRSIWRLNNFIHLFNLSQTHYALMEPFLSTDAGPGAGGTRTLWLCPHLQGVLGMVEKNRHLNKNSC